MKMRPIKFRAWDKTNKKWLLGYDYENLGGFSLTGECVILGEFASLFRPLSRLNEIAIMQFTGLVDMNGKEIYEDDIIQEAKIGDRVWEDCTDNVTKESMAGTIRKCPLGVVTYTAPYWNLKEDVVGRVEFDKGGFSELHLTKYDGLFEWDRYVEHYCVVGNIYENPELLK